MAFLLGSGLASVSPWLPRLCVLAAIVLLFMLIRSRSYWPALIFIIGAVLVLVRPPVPLPEPGELGYGTSTISGYFVSPPRRVSGGYSQRFRITEGARGLIKETDLLSARAFEVGQSRSLDARLVAPRKKLNPGTRSPEPVAFLEGASDPGLVVMTPKVWVNRIRAGLDMEIERIFPPQEAALIAAVTTGGRLPGAGDIRGAFRDAGLAHLFSISGTHFGFFALVLFALLRMALVRLPRKWLERMCEHITPSEAAALLTFPFMLAYLFLSGARVPSVRAFVMTGMFLAGLLLGRRGGWLPFLGLAASVIVVIDPQALSGLSFQMSFLAVLFIGMFIWHGNAGPPEYEDPGAQAMPGKLWMYVRGLVFITLAASVGLFPLVAYYFHYVSLVSPVANFIVGPLVSMALVPLSLFGAAAYILTGYYVTWPLVALVSKASVWLAELFASVPMASVEVPSFPAGVLVLYYGGFALWFMMRQSQMRLRNWLLIIPVLSVLLGAVIVLDPMPPGEAGMGNTMRVTFPDTGRADAAVVELSTSDGREVLVVDAARSGHEVASYLRLRGIRTIDALVLSHAHADHAGGVRRLIDEFEVQEVWDGGWVEYTWHSALEGIPRRTFRRGDVIEGEGFNILVLHPYEGYETQEEGVRAVNDRSLVFRLTGGGVSFMFTGDIGGDAAANIRQIPSKWLQADVLKAPHHGLDAPPLEVMLDATGAHSVVATTTKLTKASMLALEERPWVKAYVTGSDGAVSLLASDGKIRVSVYSEALLSRWPSLQEEGRNIIRLFSSWPGS